VAILVGVVAFAVLTGVLVAQASGRRDAGEGVTGEVTRTPTQVAARCIDLTVSDELVDAVECYRDVLEDDPDNAVAHTYLGWTLYLTARGSADELPRDTLVELYIAARRQLDDAVEADPRYADARAFQIVLAVEEGRFEEAAEQLEAFDDLDAPADMRLLVDGQRAEITDGLAATDGSTASSSTTTSAPGG
jgi:tetratricopeptide (TPR) repeat protein